VMRVPLAVCGIFIGNCQFSRGNIPVR
jgi:hypothetical protein